MRFYITTTFLVQSAFGVSTGLFLEKALQEQHSSKNVSLEKIKALMRHTKIDYIKCT